MALMRCPTGAGTGGGGSYDIKLNSSSTSAENVTIDLTKKYLVQNCLATNGIFCAWYEVNNGVVSECIDHYESQAGTPNWWTLNSFIPSVTGNTLTIPTYGSSRHVHQVIEI